MATLTFSYDTGSVTTAEVVDGLAAFHGYQATINGAPNPQTKAQFVKQRKPAICARNTAQANGNYYWSRGFPTLF